MSELLAALFTLAILLFAGRYIYLVDQDEKNEKRNNRD